MRQASISAARRMTLGLLLVGTLLSTAEAKGRKYYLTKEETFDGSEALTACAKGYHMASLWELLDPSNLTYDTKLGLIRADAGSGPPAGFEGWIRTGFNSSSTSTAGQGNCNAWTSNDGGNFGTDAFLSIQWEGTSNPISPWVADSVPCNATLPVWCISGK